MESRDWRTQPALKQRLREQPHAFQALQLIRLLQQLEQKPVRVNAQARLDHVPAEVEAVSEKEKHIEVTSNAGGLFGAQGVLPTAFTEELISLQKNKNQALLDFLNLIQQRYFQLDHASWRKYRPALLAEQGANNSYRETLQALCGFSGSALQQQLKDKQGGQLQWAGHWARPVRSAANLKQYLSLHFGVKAHIEQFIPSALSLTEAAQTRISQQNSANNQLGMNAVLGETSWQLQYQFAVHIEVRNQAELESLKPAGDKYKAMQQAIALYCGPEQSFSIKLSVNTELFEPALISQQNVSANQLGWGMQLKRESTPTLNDEKENIELELTGC